MIKLTSVSKTYKNGTHALYNINLDIQAGEFVYVTGATGSGKSTLIKLLDGEEIPTKGEIMVDGTNVGKLKHRQVPKYRRIIGVVFQDYRLLARKTVFENVAYALEVVDTPKKEIRERVREVLKLVDLSDKSAMFPDELSGGQQQRVAIARAIANRPKILICDEPTGNLDPKMSDEIITLLEKINQEEKTTILMVTHDVVIIENHPKRNIILEKGHIVSDRFSGPTPSAATEEKPVEAVSENEQIELNIGLEEESAGEQ
ncbi:MAG: cell division ATP-binding protein FtsE [Erysipelotrichaceae bacterium]|jgi:cell division transport system ATP-binding protein|nr:cell division ATP-binding protein FtsE [Erysipelotrichaceae bacterium]